MKNLPPFSYHVQIWSSATCPCCQAAGEMPRLEQDVVVNSFESFQQLVEEHKDQSDIKVPWSMFADSMHREDQKLMNLLFGNHDIAIQPPTLEEIQTFCERHNSLKVRPITRSIRGIKTFLASGINENYHAFALEINADTDPLFESPHASFPATEEYFRVIQEILFDYPHLAHVGSVLGEDGQMFLEIFPTECCLQPKDTWTRLLHFARFWWVLEDVLDQPKII